VKELMGHKTLAMTERYRVPTVVMCSWPSYCLA